MKKLTKKTLVVSLVSIAVCLTLIIGATMAWFTDAVGTKGNNIGAGTLKVASYYADYEAAKAGTWTAMTSDPIFGDIDWEPGYMAVKFIKIENTGTLAFEWNLGLVRTEGTTPSELPDVIDVYCKTYSESELASLNLTRTDVLEYTDKVNLATAISNDDSVISGSLLKDQTVVVCVALNMQENAGNEYKKMEDEFDVVITAKQYASESDAFGSDYDSAASDIPVYDNGNMTGNPLENLEINNGDYIIADNIYLPTTYNGLAITWKSSDNSIVTDTASAIDFGGDSIAAYDGLTVDEGMVTRGSSDEYVTMIATTEAGYSKGFILKIKALPETPEYTHYLYADFHEPLVDAYHQQVFYAVSDDGLHWEDLNYAKPVVTSEMGTQGLRDHFIVQSHYGDKYYLICTDLEILQYEGNWGHHGGEGSQYLMVWESDDLVTWGEQRMVHISTGDIGCTWAPECIYDELTGQYVIYYSGEDHDGIVTKTTDGVSYSNLNRKVVYYVTTRDFYTFSEPKLFTCIGNYQDSISLAATADQSYTEFDPTDSTTWKHKWGTIDTTMIKAGGWYYRITKNEYTGGVTLDRSNSVLGEYELVETNLNNSEFLGVEGPAIFKMNYDDTNGDDVWCLMLDGFGGNAVGWFPCLTSDLSDPNTTSITFRRLSTSEYQMPYGPKHGVMLPIITSQYNALVAKYGLKGRDDVAETYVNSAATADITVSNKNGATTTTDTTKGEVYAVSNGSYLEVAIPKDSNGNVIDRFTVSFDVLNNKYTGDYYSLTIGDTRSDYNGEGFTGIRLSETGLYINSRNKAWDPSTDTTPGNDHTGETFQSSYIRANTDGYYTDVWQHIDIVVNEDIYTVYVNGILKTKQYAWSIDQQDASIIRFGFDPGTLTYEYPNGVSTPKVMHTYTDALYANIKVYNGALSQTGIDNNFSSDDKENVVIGDNFVSLNFNNSDLSTEHGLAVLRGNATYIDGAISLEKGNYISLFNKQGDAIVDSDTDAFTVSFWIKSDSTETDWAFYLSGSQYASDRQYIGIINYGTAVSVERGTLESSGTYTSNHKRVDYNHDGWNHVALVLDQTSYRFYVNGELKADMKDCNVTLSELLGDNATCYINYAPWGNGESSSASYDDYTIIHKALTEAEVSDIYNSGH